MFFLFVRHSFYTLLITFVYYSNIIYNEQYSYGEAAV